MKKIFLLGNGFDRWFVDNFLEKGEENYPLNLYKFFDENNISLSDQERTNIWEEDCEIGFSKIVNKELANEKSETMINWVKNEVKNFHELIENNIFVKKIKNILEDITSNIDSLKDVPPWEEHHIEKIDINNSFIISKTPKQLEIWNKRIKDWKAKKLKQPKSEYEKDFENENLQMIEENFLLLLNSLTKSLNEETYEVALKMSKIFNLLLYPWKLGEQYCSVLTTNFTSIWKALSLSNDKLTSIFLNKLRLFEYQPKIFKEYSEFKIIALYRWLLEKIQNSEKKLLLNLFFASCYIGPLNAGYGVSTNIESNKNYSSTFNNFFYGAISNFQFNISISENFPLVDGIYLCNSKKQFNKDDFKELDFLENSPKKDEFTDREKSLARHLEYLKKILKKKFNSNVEIHIFGFSGIKDKRIVNLLLENDSYSEIFFYHHFEKNEKEKIKLKEMQKYWNNYCKVSKKKDKFNHKSSNEFVNEFLSTK